MDMFCHKEKFLRCRKDFFEVIVALETEVRPTWLTHLIGRKIHLRTLNGMYTVVRATKYKLCLTANTIAPKEFWVDNSEFRCIAGGKYRNQVTRFHEDPEVTGLPW
jgi:hypothetical protein